MEMYASPPSTTFKRALAQQGPSSGTVPLHSNIASTVSLWPLMNLSAAWHLPSLDTNLLLVHWSLPFNCCGLSSSQMPTDVSSPW